MSGPHSAAATATTEAGQHSIRAVERRTGLSQHVLRAWERRYGVLNPTRTASGERLYSDADVERLRLVQQATAGGRRVGSVIRLPLETLRQLIGSDALHGREAQPATPRDVSGILTSCLDAARRVDPSGAYLQLMQAAAALDAVTFIEAVAAPLLRVVGAEWEAGTLSPAGEHAFSSGLRRVTAWLLETVRAPAGAPVAVLGTLPEQRHEFGAAFAAITAATSGWRVVYLDGDLPVDDIAHAASVAGADAVGISLVTSPGKRILHRDAAQLRSMIPESVPLVAGGAGALRSHRTLEASGVAIVSDLGSWAQWLDATRERLQPQ